MNRSARTGCELHDRLGNGLPWQDVQQPDGQQSWRRIDSLTEAGQPCSSSWSRGQHTWHASDQTAGELGAGADRSPTDEKYKQAGCSCLFNLRIMQRYTRNVEAPPTGAVHPFENVTVARDFNRLNQNEFQCCWAVPVQTGNAIAVVCDRIDAGIVSNRAPTRLSSATMTSR